jgi:hypothetical protein
MGAFEAAWSVVKSNPNHQAFGRINEGLHPDTEENTVSNFKGAYNLGTVDPNALIYALLAADYPRDSAHQYLALGDPEHGPHTGRASGLNLEARTLHDGSYSDPGFRSQREKDDDEDYRGSGSVSRMPRPRASTKPAPAGTPQRVLEDLEAAED